MKVIHMDTWSTEGSTIGTLKLGNFRCVTLELPWMDNEQNISCVPAGDYPARVYDSPKHGQVVLLESVPHRTFIEIHSGNYTRQIEGCILVGDSIKYLDKDDTLDVTNSLSTLRKLVARLPDKFTVNITRAFSPEVS